MEEIVQQPPDTCRDVLVTLNGRRAFGFYDNGKWFIFPDDIENGHIDLNVWMAYRTVTPVISWEEITQEAAWPAQK